MPIEIRRRRMHFLAKILVKRSTLTKAGLLIGGQSILRPKACRRVVLVLVVPIMRDLLIVLAKLYIVLSLPVVSLVTILPQRYDSARQD